MKMTSAIPDSVLIIQTGFLGDAVLATGMLRSLREADPSIRTGFLVRAEFADIFRDHPGIDTLHPYDKRSKGGTSALVEALKKKEYAAALVPHRSVRSALIPFRAGIPRRLGFRQSEAGFLFTERIEYDIALREIDRNARLLERAGIRSEPETRRGWLVPAPDAVKEMNERFPEGERTMLIAPGSVWETKRWSPEGFAELALALQTKGYRVLLVGSPKERALCEAVADRAGLPEENLPAGKLSLVQLVALCSVVRRVITNDSAPLHIAESLGTPVTALFGPTVPEFGFAPYLPESNVVQRAGLPCRPCGIHGHRACPIGTHECMRGISAAEVLAAAEPGIGSVVPSVEKTP